MKVKHPNRAFSAYAHNYRSGRIIKYPEQTASRFVLCLFGPKCIGYGLIVGNSRRLSRHYECVGDISDSKRDAIINSANKLTPLKLYARYSDDGGARDSFLSLKLILENDERKITFQILAISYTETHFGETKRV